MLNCIKSKLNQVEDSLLRWKISSLIHCVKSKDSGVIFFKKSLKIVETSLSVINSFNDFLAGKTRKACCQTYQIDPSKFDQLLSDIYNRSQEELPVDETKEKKNVLERLVIHVSNRCNLRCEYCYADGGNYKQEEKLLDFNTLKLIVSKFCDSFDGITNVQYFGGEPLLNLPMIDQACRLFKEKVTAGEIESVPEFSVVTNGTISNQDMIAIFKRHSVKVTISVDGPEDIHDSLRGKGSFAKIQRLTKLLKDNQIQFGFESTFTKKHLQAGYTVKDLLHYFNQEFDQEEAHIPAVSLPEGHTLALNPGEEKQVYLEALSCSLNRHQDRSYSCISYASRILQAYTEQQPIELYCTAGFATLAVDVFGSLYPCFMFSGNPEYKMGNINDQEFPNPNRAKKVMKEITANAKHEDKTCLKCWAYPFCFGCIGADYIRNKGNLNKTSCQLNKAMAEQFLAVVANYHSLKEKQNYLLT